MWKQPPPSHLITLTLLYYQFAVGIAFNAVHNRNVQRTTERSVLSSPSLLTAAYDTNAPVDYHHSYKRDPIDDTRIDDEAAVHALLAERSEARQNRAFGVADALRDQLLNEYGVRVSDSQKIWRSGCNPGSGSGMNPKWGAAQTTAPAAGRRTNHDYIYCPTAGPFHCTDLTTEAVHAALAERLNNLVLISAQARGPAEFKHIIKRRKRN